jgi:hypothetical protein
MVVLILQTTPALRMHKSPPLFYILEQKNTASTRLSVLPRRKTLLPLDGFLLNLIFEDSSKICRGNSSLIEIYKNNWYIA